MTAVRSAVPGHQVSFARWGMQVTAFAPLDGGGNRVAGAGHEME